MLNSISYQHCFTSELEPITLKVGKVVCVGRNYLDHIKELKNEVPSQAIYFIKPSTSICDMHRPIAIPRDKGECHNELELAFLIGETLKNAQPETLSKSIAGVGLGLDLTLRDEQSALKAMGHPWERAKAFDGACPLSHFVRWDNKKSKEHFQFTLTINGQRRQYGDSKMMMRPILELIADMSQHFTLEAGDVVLSGTPKGVGALHTGDKIEVSLQGYFEITSRVVSA